MLDARVAAQAPDEHAVGPRQKAGHRVRAARRIIHHGDARSRLERRARRLDAHLFGELHVDRLAMAAQNRHAHARRRHLDVIISHDLLRLDDHLPLLLGGVVIEKLVDMGNAVEGDAMRERLHRQLVVGLAIEELTRLVVKARAWRGRPHPMPLGTWKQPPRLMGARS